MNVKITVFKLVSLAFVSALIIPAVAFADPCLIVYPAGPTVYHYDSNEYYTVTFGDPLYDPLYDRGGEVLIDINTDEIPWDIYQTPNLIGFEMSTDGNEGYFFVGSTFDLVIDGFNNQPTTYENIILVFDPDPELCDPSVTVDGNPVTGNTYPIGDLVVSTPTQDGNNYSDTITMQITWTSCYGVRIWAYADEDYNGMKDGGDCFTAFSHDLTVPTENKSWGAIKSLYQ
ncbi:MAG: hypothetical protein JSW58_12060 [Candidatus Latescibacterota bacterium]|nr:MAG: hypothetical protein JSW58_12060 [Candidatus Latescibacterota bacterium]